jgi:hypothetical protein
MILEIYEEMCLKNEKTNKINEKKIANLDEKKSQLNLKA